MGRKYALTEKVKKLRASSFTNNSTRKQIFNLEDRPLIPSNFTQIIEVYYWLMCEENDEYIDRPIYYLESYPKALAEGFRGFYDMEKAVTYYLEYIT